MAKPTCPPVEQLRALNLGLLDPELVEEISNHLAQCRDCRLTLHEFGPENDTLLERLRTLKEADSDVEDPGIQRALAVFKAAMLDAHESSATATAASFHAGAEPKQFGHYRLLRPLGQGGMGTVYEAEHLLMRKTVALKILSSHRLGDREALARFRREIEAIARLDHPHLVRATDAGEVDGNYYLVMELLEGIDLARFVERVEVLPVPDACESVVQAARALEHAHEHGLIHRDVKPSNLMLTPDGQIKLLDLGLARLTRANGFGDELTGTGQLMGTADYMAPEQISNPRNVDAQADVYSLGCTLYKLLCGVPPFHGPEYETAYKKLRAHANETPPAIRTHRLDVPRELEAVVAQMMKKKPKRRFQSASQVIRALEPFAAGSDLARLYKQCFRQATGSEQNAASTQEFRSSASVDTDARASTSGREPFVLDRRARAPRTQSARARRRRTIRLTAITALLGALLVAVGIVRIQTRKGELVIKTVDPHVEVQVTQRDHEVAILDLKTGRRLRLRPGEYALELRGEAEGLELSTRQFTIKRGEDTLVEVRFEAESSEESHRLQPSAKKIIIKPEETRAAHISRSPQPTQRETVELPQLGTWQPGPAENALPGLIPRPAALPGIKRWNVETIQPRVGLGQMDEVVWSPDSRRFACPSGNSIRMYEADTGRLVRLFPHQTLGGSVSLAWSPDGKRLASAGYRTLHLWAVEAAKPAAVISQPAVFVNSLAWSPDGKWLASGGRDKIVRLWSAADGRPGPVLVGHTGWINSVSWSPDSRRIVSGAEDKTVRLWDATEGTTIRVVDDLPGAVSSVGWSPDGKWIASGTSRYVEHSLSIWSAEDGSPGPAFSNPDKADVTSLAWSPDSRRIVTSGWKGSFVWEVATGLKLMTIKGNLGVSWSPDGRWIACKERGSARVLIRDATTGRLRTGFGLNNDPVAVAWSPNGGRIATGQIDGSVRMWHTDNGKPGLVLREHEDTVVSLVFSPDGRQIASASKDGTLRLWDGESEKAKRALPIRSRGVAWSPDGRRLAIAGDNVFVWEPPDGPVKLWQGGQKGPVNAVAWSPDGRLLASAGGSQDKTIQLWSAGDEEIVRVLEGHDGGVSSLAWSTDGRRLASTSNVAYMSPMGNDGDNTLRVWDVDKGRQLHVGKPSMTVSGLAWSPDGRLLAVGGFEREWMVSLLHAVAYTTERTLSHEGRVGAVAWSPDSRQVVSAGLANWMQDSDCTVRRWDARTGELVWMGVILSNEGVAAFSGSGERLHGGPDIDNDLVYVVEKPDGALELLSPSEFDSRVGTST